jgi:hypothetical protein
VSARQRMRFTWENVDPRGELPNDPDHPDARYTGPHGPCDLAWFDDQRRLRVWGRHVPEGIIEFEHGAAEDSGRRVDQLRAGLPGHIGPRPLRVQLPGRPGLARSSRTLRVQLGDAEYQLRVRGLFPKKLVLERADGSVVARFAIRWTMTDKVAEDATGDEVVLAILLLRIGVQDELSPRL